MNTCKYELTIKFNTLFLGTMDLGGSESERFTGFMRDVDGGPLLQAYQLLGFLKEAASALGPALGIYDLRCSVERLVFVEPRVIPLRMPLGKGVSIQHRHKRVRTSSTRVSTVPMRSEAVPVGTTAECFLVIYPGFDESVLRELLDYGVHGGMGQWRSAGYGTFDYNLVPL